MAKENPLRQQYRKQEQWFRELVQWRGSVMPAILPKVFLCGVFSAVVTGLYKNGINVAIPVKTGLIPSIVLGLLLVFRTNTAYDRFWEGRKIWGTLVNTVRNLSRGIWQLVHERSPTDRAIKKQVLQLLLAFAVALKLHLRGERVNRELASFMAIADYEALTQAQHPPLRIAAWIGEYLQGQYQQHNLNAYQLNALLKLLDSMVDCLGACERILKTPIPAAYAIHLKQLVFLYCLTLPFELVDQLLWLTPGLVGLISFAILGIEEIGAEIENPFGYDANDLPLDRICETMQQNIDELIETSSPQAIALDGED